MKSLEECAKIPYLGKMSFVECILMPSVWLSTKYLKGKCALGPF
jgi:hypothetical protein